MSSVSSFLKFTDDESVMQEWEILDDPAGFRAGDLLVFGFLWLIMAIGQQFGRALVLTPDIGGFLFEYAGTPSSFVFFSVWGPVSFALALTVWLVVSRPKIQGYMSLTNWRFIYYERGVGRFKRSHHRVVSANIVDIVGIHSTYAEGLFGQRALTLKVHTKYEGGVVLRVGHSGGLVSKIPVIGHWFSHNTIGKDAFTAMPVAFRLVQASQGKMADPDISY
jgi:hypothetical protein